MFIAITASLQEGEAARRMNAADNQSLFGSVIFQWMRYQIIF